MRLFAQAVLACTGFHLLSFYSHRLNVLASLCITNLPYAYPLAYHCCQTAHYRCRFSWRYTSTWSHPHPDDSFLPYPLTRPAVLTWSILVDTPHSLPLSHTHPQYFYSLAAQPHPYIIISSFLSSATRRAYPICLQRATLGHDLQYLSFYGSALSYVVLCITVALLGAPRINGHYLPSIKWSIDIATCIASTLYFTFLHGWPILILCIDLDVHCLHLAAAQCYVRCIASQYLYAK